MIENLSTQQYRALELAAQGLSNEAIAKEMGLKVATVKVHLTKVFLKLGVFNRVQAVLIYQERTGNVHAYKAKG